MSEKDHAEGKFSIHEVFYGCLLVITIWFVYAQCRHFEFLFWDDDIHISGNKLMQKPSWESLKTLSQKPFFGLYIPVTYIFWLFLAWVSSLWSGVPGLDPTVFHTANIILHSVNACLVYALARKLIESSTAAIGGALIFAIHPLQVETVAWISGGKDLLSTMFGLLALHSLLLKKFQTSWWITLIVSSLFYLLAILSKPAAVVLPLVALLIFAWQKDLNVLTHQRRWVIFVAWAVIAIPVVALTNKEQSIDIATLPVTSFIERILIASDALCFYVKKIFWPHPLIVDYGRVPETVLASPWRLWGLIIWPAVMTGGIWAYHTQRLPLLLAGMISITAWLPNLGLLPFAYQKISTVADRYAYGPMLGVALGFGWIYSRVLFKRLYGICLMIGLTIPMGYLSFVQCEIFRNTKTLFLNVIHSNPRSLSALNNLGIIDLRDGKVNEGLKYLQAAAAISPSSFKTIDNIGVGMQMLGRAAEAVGYHQRAGAISPQYSTSFVNLGNAYRTIGKKSEAESAFVEALRIEPTSSLAHNNYGAFLENEGRLAEAEGHYNSAIALSIDPFLAYYNLGALYENSGRKQLAMKAYLEAFKLRPSSKLANDAINRVKQ